MFCLRFRKKKAQPTTAIEAHAAQREIPKEKSQEKPRDREPGDRGHDETPEREKFVYYDQPDQKCEPDRAFQTEIEPYQALQPENELPTYRAYKPADSITHPDFPEDAIDIALHQSNPTQPFTLERLNRIDRQGTEREQTQFLNSIQYGDQVIRGLNELGRFQEDLTKEVAEQSGMTVEQLERQKRLMSWDEESQNWSEVEDDSDVDDTIVLEDSNDG